LSDLKRHKPHAKHAIYVERDTSEDRLKQHKGTLQFCEIFQGLLTLSESGLLRASFSQDKERGVILAG